MSEKYVLGIDIGGTYIKYGYIDQYFTIQKQWKKETRHFATKDEFYDYLCEGIDAEIVECVGISTPGLIDRTSLVKTRAAKTVENMYGTTVNEEVGKRLNKFTATINDAKAAGLCELKIGNAQETKSSGYLIIGTGVGGCLCNSEDVIYGNDGFAGEVHFIPYYDAATGKILKLGNQCSMRKLIQLYNEKVSEDSQVQYGMEVTEKYLAKDPIACEVMKVWIQNLVMDVINMVVTYNPEIICIGGGISEEEWFIKLLQEKYREISIPFFNATEEFLTTKITNCKYNNSSNLLGAAIKVTMEKEKLKNL